MMSGDMGDMKGITQEEISKLTKAMKDKQFRDHMDEYCKEVSDPANRKEYLEYLDQLEAKGEMPDGQQLLRCQPGLCVKTAIQFRNGQTQKCFINIVHSERLDELSMTDAEGGGGKQVHLPYSLSPPRPDRDHKDEYCMTCDFAVSTGTFARAVQNPQILKMLVDTAADGLAQQFLKGHEEVKKDFTVMKRMNCKGGAPLPMSVRGELLKGNKPKVSKPNGRNAVTPGELRQMRQEAKKNQKHVQSEPEEESKAIVEVQDAPAPKEPEQHRIRVPKHRLVYSGSVDLADFMQAGGQATVTSTVPRLLRLVVELPTVKKSSDVTLEVTENNVVIEVPEKFYLDLPLTYTVREDQGKAQFDKVKQVLTLELPVRADAANCRVLRPPPSPQGGNGKTDDGGLSERGSDDEEDAPLEEPQEQRPPAPAVSQPEGQMQAAEPLSVASASEATEEAPLVQLVEEVEPSESFVQAAAPAADAVPPPPTRPVPHYIEEYVHRTSSLSRAQAEVAASGQSMEVPLTWRQNRQNLLLVLKLPRVEVCDVQLSVLNAHFSLSFCLLEEGRTWRRVCLRQVLWGTVDPVQWHADLIGDGSSSSNDLEVVIRKAVPGEEWRSLFVSPGLTSVVLETCSARLPESGTKDEDPAVPAVAELKENASAPVAPVGDTATLDAEKEPGGAAPAALAKIDPKEAAAVAQSASVMGQSVLLTNRLFYQLL